jgi:hypothetical protein
MGANDYNTLHKRISKTSINIYDETHLSDSENSFVDRKVTFEVIQDWIKEFIVLDYFVSAFQSTPDDDHLATEKLVKDALDLKATDSLIVHLSGSETITGNKTFSGTNQFNVIPRLDSGMTLIPTLDYELASKVYVDNLTSPKENSSNKVTAFQVTPDDSHYISEKLAYDQLALKFNSEYVITTNTTISVSTYSELITAIDNLKTYLLNSNVTYTIKLTANINATSYIEFNGINKDGDIVFDTNGYNITSTSSVFRLINCNCLIYIINSGATSSIIKSTTSGQGIYCYNSRVFVSGTVSNIVFGESGTSYFAKIFDCGANGNINLYQNIKAYDYTNSLFNVAGGGKIYARGLISYFGNKCTSEDSEIINFNEYLYDGSYVGYNPNQEYYFLYDWKYATEVWSYGSSTTILVAKDVSIKYSKNMKICWYQSPTYKYGKIVDISYSSPNTTITIIGDDVLSSAITENYYSSVESPVNFPEIDKITISSPAIEVLSESEILLHEITVPTGKKLFVESYGISIINNSAVMYDTILSIGTYESPTYTELNSTDLRYEKLVNTNKFIADDVVQFKIINNNVSSKTITAFVNYIIM